MTTMKKTALSLAILSALGLAGCLGGGSNDQSGSGTAAKIRTTGVITGFGSVYVNGVEYMTSADTTYTLDDSSGDEDGLAVGMIVTIEGSVNEDGTTGTATEVAFSDDVEGPITSVSIAADETGTLSVLGQSVTITADTHFESNDVSVTTLAQLAVGHVVEISGFTSGAGTIVATHVELKKLTLEAGDEIEVKGTVAGLDTTAKTFMLGDLTVNYGTAELSDIPTSGLANGLYVEVKSTDGFNASNQLVASKVELEGDGKPGMDAEDGDEVELQGIVTAKTSDTEFTLNAQSIRITDDTEFEHGDASMIAVDVKLKVEGTMDANGVLIADEIEFHQEAETEVFMPIEAVNATAGTVTMLGQTIYVNTSTVMKDERDEGSSPVRYFSLSDLVAGDWIEAKLFVRDGKLIAASLERDDAGSSAKLEGTIDSITGTQLVIDGFTVDSAAVIGTFTVGVEIEVKGTISNGVLVATEVSLED